MKRLLYVLCAAFCVAVMFQSCGNKSSQSDRIDVIFDTDANNELDDQHAITYLLMNPESFNVVGITTNNTHNGDGIEGQTREARRIIDLAGKWGEGVVLKSGANANFEDIKDSLDVEGYDGCDAVDFIIESAKNYTPEAKLTVIAVGKLTNLALAAMKAPGIIPNIRLVWLGGNYPEPGEYNLMDDIPSMNYLLDTDIEFEFVTVRYGKTSGTDAVRVTREFAHENFGGKGPQVATPVEGRHGGQFTCFGDYSVNLFDNIKLHSDGTRSLYDLCAVAVVKNPQWAQTAEIPAPTMIDKVWVDRPDNERTVLLWENFDRDGIVGDFVATLDKCTVK